MWDSRKAHARTWRKMRLWNCWGATSFWVSTSIWESLLNAKKLHFSSCSCMSLMWVFWQMYTLLDLYPHRKVESNLKVKQRFNWYIYILYCMQDDIMNDTQSIYVTEGSQKTFIHSIIPSFIHSITINVDPRVYRGCF